jgi:hypothetical protein
LDAHDASKRNWEDANAADLSREPPIPVGMDARTYRLFQDNLMNSTGFGSALKDDFDHYAQHF